MIPITSAQISGVSYKTIGQAGLDYLVRLAAKGANVKVPSFLNPAGMDREQWKGMGIPPDFAKKQIEILDAFRQDGHNEDMHMRTVFHRDTARNGRARRMGRIQRGRFR